MKYLVAGLGNVGDEYAGTRHNIGFMVLDAMARASGSLFSDCRYGFISPVKYKGRQLILLKPSTYMNLSGNAVRYWLKREKIELENLLVIVDDIALPLGSIRMRPKGSDGGHNGLAHISSVLGTNEYARIRVGIGNGFRKGSQVHHVLGRWKPGEEEFLKERIDIVIEMIKSFAVAGTELTMTAYNKMGKMPGKEADGNKTALL
ncbi:MAG TPA: aminoacyl-tRNA hydrolase [Bacteroidales bacterium]|nr:aminoacyl-tRNA hydrolase [Bacteroidales bacterium]HOS73533.1 aminoacyl-tRNA hydrolase [Bacteroidales bacterium]HQH22847.1 aminoacyl-tRNA hydrolase [Bacteroidales bacterium]HQJ81687.1 aminoacyl-tRNA hydrolase [Bacteroidales bacterium]